MLLAVLESRCGLNFSSAEVYLNIAGGYRLTDPAADLAVAAALVSALEDRPLPDKTAWFGEVSLAGEIRKFLLSRIGTNLSLRKANKNQPKNPSHNPPPVAFPVATGGSQKRRFTRHESMKSSCGKGLSQLIAWT